MRIVIAMDSFKGSISSIEAGNVLKKAILDRYPDDIVRVFPLADGGEGTVDALAQGLHGSIVPVVVTGPLGTPVKSRFGYLPQTKTAVIEMADASGLPLVPRERRNHMGSASSSVRLSTRAAVISSWGSAAVRRTIAASAC